jgi:hypothetical protein
MMRIKVTVCPLPNKKGLIGAVEAYERYTNTQFLTLGWLRHVNTLFLTVAQRYTHMFKKESKVAIGHRVRYGMPVEKALRFRRKDLDELSLANYSIGRGNGEEL